jgi:uncharacterized protein YutE (UPF0331/DUF86 family)
MINKRLITERLLLIDGYLRELRNLALIDKESFRGVKKNGAAAESFLRRSLEAIFDIGRHILAKTGNIDISAEYKSIARGLGDLQIIDLSLAEKLVQMAGYRNRMVHMYHIISDEELYEIITTELGDIESFVSGVKKYILEH